MNPKSVSKIKYQYGQVNLIPVTEVFLAYETAKCEKYRKVIAEPKEEGKNI